MPDDSGWIPPLLQRVSPTQDGCLRKLNNKHDDLLLWRAASTILQMTYRAIGMSIVGLYSVVLLFLVYVCFTVLWICYNECRSIMFFRWRAELMEDRTSEVPVQGEGTFPWQERPKWPRRMSSQLSLHLTTVQSMILSSFTQTVRKDAPLSNYVSTLASAVREVASAVREVASAVREVASAVRDAYNSSLVVPLDSRR